MQYIRRRILRVSGVTVRDERLERQVFSAPAPAHEGWDEFLARKSDDTTGSRSTLMADGGTTQRERT